MYDFGPKHAMQIRVNTIKSAVSRSIPRLLLPANSMVPGKCNSQEKLSNHAQKLKSAASVIAKEALNYR